MDYRRQIVRLLEASYALHNRDSTIVSSDQSYSSFRSRSRLEFSYETAALSPPSVLKLCCLYLNSVLTANQYRAVVGLEWEMTPALLNAFVEMERKYSDLAESAQTQLTAELSEIPGTMCPNGIGLAVVRPGMGVHSETSGNVVRVFVRATMAEPITIIDFGNGFGLMRIKVLPYVLSLSDADNADNNDGWVSSEGRVDLVRSSALSTLTYHPLDGPPHELRAGGGDVPISGGKIVTNSALVGGYQMEFSGFHGTPLNASFYMHPERISPMSILNKIHMNSSTLSKLLNVFYSMIGSDVARDPRLLAFHIQPSDIQHLCLMLDLATRHL